MLFAKAKGPAPVLNTPDFRSVFTHPLPLCEQGLLRPIEFIALPQTPFQIVKQHSEWILQVSTPLYISDALFVDSRFLFFSQKPCATPTPQLPPKQTLLDTLYSRVGLPYIWGGNWSLGIPELLKYYPPLKSLSKHELAIHTLHGLDCSGLLYEATFGLTPRNTAQLLFYGKGVPISGKSPKEIALTLQPLDLIVWKGHVVIVGERDETIEAHRLLGVTITPLQKRLSQIIEKKQPVDTPSLDPSTFVVRRIIPSRVLSPPEAPSLHSR